MDTQAESHTSAGIRGGRIWLRCPYERRYEAAEIPGARWDQMAKLWTFPATPAVAARVVQTFPNTDGDYPQLFVDLLSQYDVRWIANRDKHDGYPNLIYPHHTPPWPHQIGATNYAILMDRALLHCHMGTGKTKMVLDAAMTRGHKQILVICPKSVIPVWQDEVEKHAPGVWDMLLLSGGSIQKRAEMLFVRVHGDSPLLVVLNYEAAWRRPLSSMLLSQEWDLVVLDESHRIKAPGSKQSRFCARLKATHMLALTGTPMPHSPLDLYGQYRALDPGIYGTSFTKFRARYAVMGGFEQRQVVSYQNQTEMRQRMDQLRYEVTADALTLPPLQVIDRECELEPAARAIYDELNTEFVAGVADGTVTASNALVKLLRLQQIAAGFVKADDGEIREVDASKETLLHEMLEDMQGERVVVFCRFHYDMNAVARGALREYMEISGRVNDYARWKEYKGPVVLAVQLQAGLGIDLTEARYGIFYTLGFSLGDYEQCIARLHRPGQEHPTIIYRLLAKQTVDVKIARALAQRAEVIRFILEGVG